MAERVRRQSTATQAFGSGRREAHDASAFYDRFTPPAISDDATVNPSPIIDSIIHADSRTIADVLAPNSVALVVTSPPYFAGKEYELTLGSGGVPASYFEYLEMLSEVFAGCAHALEPGGRIAVNVANLGRRPYRSLAADITTILSDLGLLLRGEVIWWKGRAAGGSCAWGTFQHPNNPVLRDVTERVIIASKGRFDRAVTAKQRRAQGLPSEATITRDEFLAATTDMWELPPASATRVGHPAPFPVELPQRLIELYTYAGDVVLDPFMGAGTTAVAAVQTGRAFIGFETDASYIERAEERIDAARSQRSEHLESQRDPDPVAEPTVDTKWAPVITALDEGKQAKTVAEELLAAAGFTHIRSNARIAQLGVTPSFVAQDRNGQEWAVELAGSLTVARGGLSQSDELWRVIGKAAVIHQGRPDLPFVVLTTEHPTRGTPNAKALAAMTGPERPIAQVINLTDPADYGRLEQLLG